MCGGCNQSSVTNTPNPTASAAYDNVIGQAQSVAATPYQPYTGELVAGLNGGQQRAIGQLEGAYGTSMPFFQGGLGALSNASAGLGNVQNYLQAGSQAAAGVSGYQQQAANAFGQASGYLGQSASALGDVGKYLGKADGYFGQAAGLATPQDFNGINGVQSYMNPYTQSVINATMDQARQNDAQQTASLVGNAIGNGAYGGDRSGIAVAALAGQQALANNSTVAGLNQANYQQATAQFNATQAQRQAGAQIYAGLGQGELSAGQIQGQTAQQYGTLAGLSTGIGNGYNATGQLGLGVSGAYNSLGQLQGTAGQAYGTLGGLYGNLGTQAQQAAVSGASAGLQGATLQQQTQQARDTANYNQFQNQIQYPFNSLGYLSNIVQGIGSASGGTQTTQGNALSGIAGAATSGLGVLGVTGAFGSNGYLTGANGLFSASDARVKENIAPIGETYDGQTIHRFNYKGDDPRDVKTGLIAQEVAGRDPGAVGHMGGGVMGVDYDRATRGAAERGRFARGGGLGSVARMLAAPDPIRTNGRGLGALAGIAADGGGLGGIRPRFDDGGTVTSDQLDSSDFAQGIARNPLLASRIARGGNSSTMPGGNLSAMPGGTSGMPSGSGLGALTAAPSAGGLSNLAGSGGGSGGLSGISTQSPSSSGFSPGAASGQDSVDHDTFGPNNQNLWMSLIAGGAGAMAGGSASAMSNIGRGIQDGLSTYTRLRQNDVDNAVTRAKLADELQRTRIEQQQADQSGTSIANSARFQQGQLANQNAETAVRQSTVASENAERDQRTKIGRYSTTYVPGVGYVTRDLTNPTAQPSVSPFDPTAPSLASAATPSAAPPAPAPAPAAAAPAPSGFDRTIPGSAAPVPALASRPQAPAAPSAPPAAAGAGWQPTTAVPSGYVPPNQMAIYNNPGVLKGEQENATKSIETSRAQATAGQQLQMRLDEMDRQFAQLPKTGMLSAGAAATARGDIAKGINTFAGTLGLPAPYDPNQVAANENLLKDRFRLGADLAKQMGGREPGYIVEQAVKANPGADNTPLAYQRITAGLRQAAQYQQDSAAFFDDYNAKFGHLNGAQQAFDKLNPPQRYADRAVISTVDPRDVSALQANARNPDAVAAIDRKYGAGTSAVILRQ